MSYYTVVRLDHWGDESVTDEMLLAEARAHLEGLTGYAVDDILSDLARGFRTGSTSFNKLYCADLTNLFRSMSRTYPTVRFRIWGHGENPKDIWSRELLGGKVAYKRGPFNT